MIRLHVQEPLQDKAVLTASEDQAHYLCSVMRLKPEDRILVFNGQDGEWTARVAQISRRGCVLEVQGLVRPQTRPPELDLIVALVKRPRLETIVEKAVELGALRIRLLLTRRTNSDRANVARLQAIAVEAAEQTGRLEVPRVTPPEAVEGLLQSQPQPYRLMYCDEAGDEVDQPWGGRRGRAASAAACLAAFRTTGAPGPWGVMIGPEGGFSPEERALLRGQSWVTPVSLGPRILRSDTAAIAALTLWQSVLGDWVDP
jgi:16S rRNA (uracil1498-N3)-methyltransferase